MRHRVTSVCVLSLHYRESPRHFTAPVTLILQFLEGRSQSPTSARGLNDKNEKTNDSLHTSADEFEKGTKNLNDNVKSRKLDQ